MHGTERTPHRHQHEGSPAARPARAGWTAVAVVAGLLAACGAGASDDGAQTPSTAPPPVNTSSSPVAPAAQTTGTSPSIPFDAARAWEHLQRQVAFGPRPAGSEALAACRRYIIEQLKSVGLEVREQAFRGDTPAGSIPMVNVSAVIPGRRPERIIIGTHYDTKLFRDIRFLGASDGASSTAAAIELARVLSGRAGEYTIELLFLDGEEAVLEWAGTDHTYGSRHYVEEAQRTGDIDAIKAFVLLDMIGDRDLDIRRDANSTPWLVDVVWQTAARLGHARTFVDVLTTIEDDHIPFVRAGIPSVDIIDLNYAAWHTADDDLSRVSANSLQVVGDVVLAALPEIERRLAAQPR